jgi:V/A-type H+-transporting ATPase subunit C
LNEETELSDDFGYLNARVRARRSRLLPEGFFREALNLNFSELVKVLGESIYGPDLTGDTLADVDRAVTVHLKRTVADLPHLASGEAQEAVSLLLMRADLANVKTILRGKLSGWSADEITGYLAGGTLPQGLYKAMAEAADAASLAQVLSLLKHPLARVLREASQTSREPLEMEVSLDLGFFKEVLRRSRELDQPYLADFICFEIDASNLATGVKLFTVGFEGPSNRFFLQGGHRVGLSLFQRLAGGEMAALEELRDTDFGRVAEARDLATLERSLRCALLAKAHEEAKDALGAGLAIDYIQCKEWEACRIRFLARGAYYNLLPPAVEKEVFCH